MIWFYERDSQALQLETAYDNETAEYVAVVQHPDGRKETARFSDADSFRDWLMAFEDKLSDDRFVRRGP
ncbi:MAG: hypothetical protein ACRD3J_02040, partial [Thermoanaerobaculia bacterium]